MTRRAEITSPMVALMLEAVRARGGDVAALRRWLGLADQAPADEVRVKLDDFRAMSEAASAMVKDPHFGLHVAQSVPRGGYGLVEFLARSARTLRQGIAQMVRYGLVVNEGAEFSFTEGKQTALLEHRVPGQPQAYGRQGNEYTLAILLRIARDAAAGPVNPVRAYFAHPGHEQVAPLFEYLGTRQVEFGARANGLVLSKDLLDTPMKNADDALHAFLDTLSRQALASKGRQGASLDGIREAVQRALRQGEPSLDRVANQLAVSARTLQRRLSDEGTTFQKLLDDVRERLARAYLHDRRLGVAEVAYLLGYSELRAFDRAFRRWTGQSPRDWRQARQ